MSEMKTEYKYIEFEKSVRTFKDKPMWTCLNCKSQTPLATAFWYKPWRQYVIAAEPNCVFNTTCLADIIDFLNQLNGKKGK